MSLVIPSCALKRGLGRGVETRREHAGRSFSTPFFSQPAVGYGCSQGANHEQRDKREGHCPLERSCARVDHMGQARDGIGKDKGCNGVGVATRHRVLTPAPREG